MHPIKYVSSIFIPDYTNHKILVLIKNVTTLAWCSWLDKVFTAHFFTKATSDFYLKMFLNIMLRL